MWISERRQGIEIPAPGPDQPRDEVSFSGLSPGLVPAVLPERVDRNRMHLPAQSDPVGGGKVVYAVYGATGCASRNCKADSGFVEEYVSDELLLKSVAKGDKAAMHIMFARHRVKVFRFILRIVRNPAIADDLVSQVFLDVWRSANRFEHRSKVSTWLLSIARLKALGSLREPMHVSVEKANLLEIADAADTPDLALDRKNTKATLRAGIEKLSPAHREIIDLIYYQEMSVAEASDLLGIPHATVKSRMFYARKQLARILVGIGFEVEAIQASVHKAEEARPSRGLRLELQAGRVYHAGSSAHSPSIHLEPQQ